MHVREHNIIYASKSNERSLIPRNQIALIVCVSVSLIHNLCHSISQHKDLIKVYLIYKCKYQTTDSQLLCPLSVTGATSPNKSFALHFTCFCAEGRLNIHPVSLQQPSLPDTSGSPSQIGRQQQEAVSDREAMRTRTVSQYTGSRCSDYFEKRCRVLNQDESLTLFIVIAQVTSLQIE